MLRFGWLLAAGLLQAAGGFAVCTTAADCAERVPLGPEGRFSVVYRSHPLTERNTSIERALIVVHGAGRNADSYFRSGVASALLAGALENTVIMAPRLASSSGGDCRDTLQPGEISWTCGGDRDWRGGGAAQGLQVGTFDLMDELVRRLARRDVFPNLRSIVVTGHSAGGQFVGRYAALTRVETGLGLTLRYVVANPSSYMYLDARRLAARATCSRTGGCSGGFGAYARPSACPGYNRWRYGTEQRSGYAARVTDGELQRNFASRDVVYLLGEFDTLPVYGFDSSCEAMAQGPTRLARGITYWNYVRSGFGAQHKLVVVPACGHNGRCMYTSDEALPVLFPR